MKKLKDWSETATGWFGILLVIAGVCIIIGLAKYIEYHGFNQPEPDTCCPTLVEVTPLDTLEVTEVK